MAQYTLICTAVLCSYVNISAAKCALKCIVVMHNLHLYVLQNCAMCTNVHCSTTQCKLMCIIVLHYVH